MSKSSHTRPPSPPRWADRIFIRICKDEFLEIILGDLHEMFQRRLETHSQGKARWLYLKDMASAIRPFALKRPFPHFINNIIYFNIMFRHFLKSSFRNLKRNKAYTAINVLGLTLGILSSLVIFLKVRHETGFDKHHQDGDRLYRVLRKVNNYGEWETGGGVPRPLAPALRNGITGIEKVALIDGSYFDGIIEITADDGSVKRYQEEEGVAYVDEEYLDMFYMEWLEGNKKAAFENPHSVILSKSLASKFFGGDNPVGKSFSVNGEYDLKVTGLISDPVLQTDLPYKMLLPYKLREKDIGQGEWGSVSSSVQCFIRLEDQANWQELEESLPGFLEKDLGEDRHKTTRFLLQPLAEMHFDYENNNLAGTAISRESLWILGMIGIFLIITACINFVNLSTALVFRRGREVGVRKVLGSSRKEIILHFLGETGLLTLVSILLALAFLSPALGWLREWIGENVALNYAGDIMFWLGLAALWLGVTLFSGIYPSWLLSRMNPVNAIKNQWNQKYSKGLSLRKGLIITQFMISQVLIIGTITMVMQMDYFRNAPLGYNKDAIIEVNFPSPPKEKRDRFKTLLLQNPDIRSVAFSNSGASSDSRWISNFSLPVGEEVREDNAHIKMVDEDYILTYGMEVIAGDARLPESDTVTQFLVNEAFLRSTGIQSPEDALGMTPRAWGVEAPITGVVRDFHAVSLHEKIEPLMIWNGGDSYYFTAIKLTGNNVPEVIKWIRKSWHEVFPERIFEYKFLDENLAKFYEDEEKTARMIQLFALIAILIGCLGLFGLISFMTAQRVKEIGVRKVLGASVGNIMGMFTREFAVMVTIGFAIAAPVAWYFADNWLQEFAYRISIGPVVFIAGIGVSMIIAFATVGYKSWQAARANPVEALRNE